MKKKLDETAITNELQGSSFFKKPQGRPVTGQKRESKEKPPSRRKKETRQDTEQPRNHDTVIPRHRDELIEAIRVAVKQLGKEAATYRFTAKEKDELADIVYTYRRDGTRTSENEITRIAINFLVRDYKENGENSVLSRVLKRLNE